jgi:3,4-dihydroxy 2-butanone 4-phosphate synthase/GTP cyclohydrolase II
VADDPQLTVRLADGANPQPVVVDSHLRFPLKANLLRDPCVRPIIATSHRSCPRKEAELIATGAQVLRVPVTADGLIDLIHLMRRLKDLGLQSVMVEGGAGIITNMLASGLADQLLITIAPRFVGGLRAVKQLPNNPRVQMPRLTNLHYASLAGDLIVRGDIVHEVSR